jgi:tetratricopeptide (TPR) repeat protein
MNNFENRSQIINQLLNNENWEKARNFLFNWLEDKPESHWLLTRLATTYYEERNYIKALDYSEQALKIAPHCPLVLWDYAGTLDMLKKNEQALKIFKSLIRRGVQRMAYEECGEGIRWARSLINDCRYRIGLIYARKGNYILAKKYLKTHIMQRNRNTPSIYKLREVKKKLAIVRDGKDPRAI